MEERSVPYETDLFVILLIWQRIAEWQRAEFDTAGCQRLAYRLDKAQINILKEDLDNKDYSSFLLGTGVRCRHAIA